MTTGGGTNVGGGGAAGTTFTGDVGLSCDVDATGSSLSSYAGADSGEEGSSGRAGSDFGLDSDDDTRDEGDITVVHSSELGPSSSGKSIVKLSEGDVTSFSKAFEIRRVLCRVLGPTGAILGRFNSVLVRDAFRMLPVSDIIHRKLE